LACAVRAVRQAQVQLGDAVVVFGAGVIGLFCLHLLSRSGAERLAVVDTNAARLEHARMFGATHLVHAGAGDVPSQLRDLFPEGADRAIDAVGLALTRRQGLLCLRRGGRLVFLGLHEDAADLPGNQVVRSEYDVVGSFCYTDGEFQVAVQHLAAGSLPEPTGWLDVRPLHTGDAAFQEQAVGAAPFSKILLTP
jgi:threonine dehydrogenase-like Zn-dependent dehydrogenase